jgi:RNA polymerase primary sigma factor
MRIPTSVSLRQEYSYPPGFGNLRDMVENLNKILSTLSPREEIVVRMRFGLGEKHDHTLEEVGLSLMLPVRGYGK